MGIFDRAKAAAAGVVLGTMSSGVSAVDVEEKGIGQTDIDANNAVDTYQVQAQQSRGQASETSFGSFENEGEISQVEQAKEDNRQMNVENGVDTEEITSIIQEGVEAQYEEVMDVLDNNSVATPESVSIAADGLKKDVEGFGIDNDAIETDINYSMDDDSDPER
jgi:hypothetical protein